MAALRRRCAGKGTEITHAKWDVPPPPGPVHPHWLWLFLDCPGHPPNQPRAHALHSPLIVRAAAS